VQVLWLTKKNRTVSGGGKKISSKLKIYPPPHQKSNGPSLKVTKCHKISQIVLSTLVTEIISINFVVYYWPVLKSGRGGGWGGQRHCLFAPMFSCSVISSNEVNLSLVLCTQVNMMFVMLLWVYILCIPWKICLATVGIEHFKLARCERFIHSE
jgi:hypothetical protein